MTPPQHQHPSASTHPGPPRESTPILQAVGVTGAAEGNAIAAAAAAAAPAAAQPPAAAAAAGEAKWDAFYALPEGAPFDSRLPSSQLQHYLTSCTAPLLAVPSPELQQQPALTADAAAARAQLLLPPQQQPGTQLHTCDACKDHKPRRGGRVLELGCGTGASACWLARHGFRVAAVDISSVALAAAAATAAAAGLAADNPRWLRADILRLLDREDGGSTPVSSSSFDLVYDCQVYHVLLRQHPGCEARLSRLLHDLLAPGGLLMILAGNADEPEIGPCVLTAQQLLDPLLTAGLGLVWLHSSRFDDTHHYTHVLGGRPLAWWALLQRERAPAAG